MSEKCDPEGLRTEIIPVTEEEEEYIDFSNGRLLTAVSLVIFVVILAANIYVFVVLGQGNS